MKNGNGFVRTHTLSSSKLTSYISGLIKPTDTATDLRHYYFHRWPHKVSGFVEGTSDTVELSSPQGQVFSQSWELRWKQKDEVFDVLLLSTQDFLKDFEVLGQAWSWCDRSAKLYPKTETRFPKGFIYPEDLSISQRYFIDKNTATVRFVSLTF